MVMSELTGGVNMMEAKLMGALSTLTNNEIILFFFRG